MADVFRELGRVENVLKSSEQPGLTLTDEAVREIGYGVEQEVAGEGRRHSQWAATEQKEGPESPESWERKWELVQLFLFYSELGTVLLIQTTQQRALGYVSLKRFALTSLKRGSVRGESYSIAVVLYKWVI